MKRYLYLLISLGIIACTVGQNQSDPTNIPETTVATSVTVVNTPSPETTEVIPPTLLPDTPTIPPTPTLENATPEPVETGYTGSLPTGRLYFLWDPVLLSFSGAGDSIQNLYLLTPTDTPDQWEFKILLTELPIGRQFFLSPDKTKIALTKVDDINGDGHASQESVNRGSDSYQLYLFDLITQDLNPLFAGTHNPYDLTWLSDSQTIVFRDGTGVYLRPLNGTSQKFLDVSPDRITWIALSPDKQTMVVNLTSSQIALVDMNSGEQFFITSEIGGLSVHKYWSKNSEWLLLYQGFMERFFLMNIPRRTITSLAEWQPPEAIAWSPTGATLAIHQRSDTVSQLVLLNPDNLAVTPILNLQATDTLGALAWSPTGSSLAIHQSSITQSQIILLDPENLSITPLLDLPVTDSLIHLSWSPDGTSLLVTTKQEQQISLQIYDLATDSLRQLWQGVNLEQFYVATWSPDAQWVLFVAGLLEYRTREDISGLFLASRQTGTTFQLLDTSGTAAPYGFFWLP